MKKTIFKAYDQMIAGSELVNASGIKLVFNILLMLFSATYINIYPVNSIVVSAKETKQVKSGRSNEVLKKLLPIYG